MFFLLLRPVAMDEILLRQERRAKGSKVYPQACCNFIERNVNGKRLLFVIGSIFRFHFPFHGFPFQFAELIAGIVVLYDTVGLVDDLFVND